MLCRLCAIVRARVRKCYQHAYTYVHDTQISSYPAGHPVSKNSDRLTYGRALRGRNTGSEMTNHVACVQYENYHVSSVFCELPLQDFLISKLQARVCVLAHARTKMKLGHASITCEAEGTLVRIRLHRSQNDQKE